MSEIVTARVPAEIRRQGNSILEELGSTPTELVRAAYEYVIATGELPDASQGQANSTPDGQLSKEERRELLASLAETTFDVPQTAWGDACDLYKDEIAEGRRADYEALA